MNSSLVLPLRDDVSPLLIAESASPSLIDEPVIERKSIREGGEKMKRVEVNLGLFLSDLLETSLLGLSFLPFLSLTTVLLIPLSLQTMREK